MRALTRELRRRGLVFDAPDYITRPEQDAEQHLLSITGDVIACVYYSNVIDPVIYLYDRRTFEPVGCQNLYRERTFNGTYTWGSYGFEEVKE